MERLYHNGLGVAVAGVARLPYLRVSATVWQAPPVCGCVKHLRGCGRCCPAVSSFCRREGPYCALPCCAFSTPTAPPLRCAAAASCSCCLELTPCTLGCLSERAGPVYSQQPQAPSACRHLAGVRCRGLPSASAACTRSQCRGQPSACTVCYTHRQQPIRGNPSNISCPTNCLLPASIVSLPATPLPALAPNRPR